MFPYNKDVLEVENMVVSDMEAGSRPVRDSAYDVLKSAIITGDLPAGSRIVETTYSKQLHISRTPLREALRKLERDGLVEYSEHRGVVVCAFSLSDVEEIYTIRNTLEMMTLPAIVEKATPEDIAKLRSILAEIDVAMAAEDIETTSVKAREFHAALTAICGMKRVIQAIRSQDEYIRRFSAMSIAHENRRSAAHEEHRRLVDLVEQKDLKQLESLMRKHIERSKQNCLSAIAESMNSEKENAPVRHRKRRTRKTEALTSEDESRA